MIPTTTGGFSHLATLLPRLALECERENAEIIIVDNASRDGTCNLLSNYECTAIIHKVNQGFAKAHNQSARIAQGKYLLLLNNDTVITDGFIKEMKSTFRENEHIAVVGCLIFRMDGVKKVQHAGVCFTQDYVPYELGLDVPGIIEAIPPHDPRVRSVREVPAVTAACMMVKRSVWDEVGGFNEEFINGWEDNDLMLRIREKGYKVWYTGRTHIYHKHFGSTSVGRFRYEQQNRKLYDSIWVDTGRAKQVLGDFRQ